MITVSISALITSKTTSGIEWGLLYVFLLVHFLTGFSANFIFKKLQMRMHSVFFATVSTYFQLGVDYMPIIPQRGT
jgi:predicted permease